jgi:hypothetical protein
VSNGLCAGDLWVHFLFQVTLIPTLGLLMRGGSTKLLLVLIRLGRLIGRACLCRF